MATQVYAYGRAGNRTGQTDARDVTNMYTYNALNRLEVYTYSWTGGRSVPATQLPEASGCMAVQFN